MCVCVWVSINLIAIIQCVNASKSKTVGILNIYDDNKTFEWKCHDLDILFSKIPAIGTWFPNTNIPSTIYVSFGFFQAAD